ncbi:unnamed protein product [Linum tenue]|uniref:Uncharacterized protein n=1 Tax=Linum tenue TaxID=586396 RepID=A0AAV0IS95_9ROSI|nr:unnamed protein product [Linum tenue]
MDLEIDALLRTNTFTVIPKPPNVKPIGNKWVYKVLFSSWALWTYILQLEGGC